MLKFNQISKLLVGLSLVLSSVAQANVLGDMQTFSPNTDGLDFITVHTARPLPKGYFAFSNYLNYAKDHLLVYKTLANQDRINYSHSLFEYDFGIAYALTEKLQVSLQAPVLVDQSSDKQDGVIVNITKGIHSYRPGFKWTIDDVKDPNFAILGSVDFPNVDNSPYTGVTSRPIYNLEAAYRIRSGGLTQGFNLGARIRNPSDTPADAHMFPLKSQLSASYGISDDFSNTARWVFEAFSSYPLDKNPYKEATDASSIDLLLALKHRWYRNLNFDWGVTVEPGVKTLAPAYRVFAGLVYYWKPESKASEPSVSTASARPFVVRPDTPSIFVGDTVQFYAEGDEEIQSCKILNGPGDMSYGCEFHGTNPGYTEVEFSNSKGETVRTTVITKETVVRGAPISFTQKNMQVYVGSSIQVRAKGGTEPLTYAIEEGDGEMTDIGFFQAPLTPQTVKIVVTDSLRQEARATIKVVEPPKADREINLKNLEFITAKAEFTPAAEKYFNNNIKQLNSVRVQKILIEGHTDSVGNDQYNLRLSRQRAAAVKAKMMQQLGYSSDMIEAIGFGESRPIATNDTVEGRQRNRRVILKVYYAK
jgi:outer membrane protein OmpA-like peptidoglycan-associated protein